MPYLHCSPYPSSIRTFTARPLTFAPDSLRCISVLVGREFWNKLIDWEWLVETGMIAADDLKLFHLVETAEEAWRCWNPYSGSMRRRR
jgi:predicted Rossmann-fold nucleotide-binding protein